MSASNVCQVVAAGRYSAYPGKRARRYVTTLRIAAGVLFGLVGFYALMGVFQAAMLFTGARALSNFNFWASVSFLAYTVSVAMLSRPWRLLHRISVSVLIAGAIGFLAAGFLLVHPVVAEFAAVDACLDAGGSYDYVRSTCDYSQNHPLIRIGWRSGFRITLCLACAAVAAAIAWHCTRRSRAGQTAPERCP